MAERLLNPRLREADLRIPTGRTLDDRGKPHREMCALYLSLMDEMGVRLDSFGDAHAPLAEI